MIDICPVCDNERDDLGLCDPYCPAIVAEDNQIRAEIAEMGPPPELTEEQREDLALILFRIRARGR